MFKELLQFKVAVSLCSAFGGALALPGNRTELERALKIANKSVSECSGPSGPLTWLDMTDEWRDGRWERVSNGQQVTFFNWSKGQPNGGQNENCAVMRPHGGWADNSCAKSFKVCTLCKLNVPVFLRLRGICEAVFYDDRFVMDGDKNKKPHFRGYYRSELYYDSELRTWRLQNTGDENTHALMVVGSKSLSYPIGRNFWKFTHGFCGSAAGEVVSLTLTQCKNGEEFTCNDGACVPLVQVCDRRAQCRDQSDELDCTLAIVPHGYQRTLPPPSSSEASDGSFEPTYVYLNITIASFYAIQSVGNRFNVELKLRFIWMDPRLKFKYLKDDRELNILQPHEMNEYIWVPEISFIDSEGNNNSVVDSKTKITVEKLGSPEEDDVQRSREARIYRGNDTCIRVVRIYNLWFRCNFNFFYFPFNTDYCTMTFQANKNTKNYVKLKKYGRGLWYEYADQLPKYKISDISFEENENPELYSSVTATIKMEHLFANEIMTIFVPTTLINTIGFATFFYKWFDFQNRMVISLTSLLVLSTFFSQVSTTLPETSYLKLVDIWFLVSIIYCFVIITTHVIIEYFHEYSNPSEMASKKLEEYPVENASVLRSAASTDVERSAGAENAPRNSATEAKCHQPAVFRDPYATPKKIDKWAFRLVISSYVVFSIIFWAVPIWQKFKPDSIFM
ncbi:glutamate-gated chloride channel subunit beta [Hyalella azteca]|uniref:Glutamate-gated chloride channel subunit beta n=1 Tax=Hyalella azteca TaxID=294128 RepID=A0A8B7NTT1_HYAAZ|nr:glutamate-gated chloride channel subunit beta [Hyalella azteca]